MSERAWSVGEALAWTSGHLGGRGEGNPRLAAEWLLSAATGLSRVELYAAHDRPLTSDERSALRSGIERRVAGEPLQHVTGEMPFRHIVVDVRPGVFIPRPETEILVDVGLAHLDRIGREDVRVVDVCTGSGAVACSVAQERPFARVWATDVSGVAVALAEANSRRLGLGERVTVLEGDLFSPLPDELRGRVDAVIANPPYIPSGAIASLPDEVRDHEPLAALDGGPDGLDVVRRLVDEARGWLAPGGLLAIESDEARANDADLGMREWYEGVSTYKDLAGRDRVVAGTLPADPGLGTGEAQEEADRP